MCRCCCRSPVADLAAPEMSNNGAKLFNAADVSGYAPIFHPTAKEFADFARYIERIEPIARPFGGCKSAFALCRLLFGFQCDHV